MRSRTKGEILLYKTPEGETEIDVKLEVETVWLTPNQMSKLFDKARPTILEHIKNAYLEGELQKNSTCRKFRQVQKEGKRTVIREIEHYNLDVIISIGYRVKSKRGTQFRIWANKVLKEQTEKIKELESYGNKRIAAVLFLWFLEMNNYLYGKDGRKRIADNALVALCLLIAESNPKEKEIIVKLVVNLINRSN